MPLDSATLDLPTDQLSAYADHPPAAGVGRHRAAEAPPTRKALNRLRWPRRRGSAFRSSWLPL